MEQTLEGATEAIELGSELVETFEELGDALAGEDHGLVDGVGDLEDEFLADTVFEEFLGVDLDDSDEGLFHGEDSLGEDGDGVRGPGEKVAVVELKVFGDLVLLDLCGELLQLVGLQLDDLVQDQEHAARDNRKHLAHIAHQLSFFFFFS